MDFKMAVERIGFPLAVLLFEDALSENTWQTATVDQCLDMRYAFSKRASQIAGGKPFPKGMLDEANKRLQQIVAKADFKTARTLCDKGDDFLTKIAYEHLFSVISTFEEACQIGEVINLWTSSSGEDLRDQERARVTQLCFSKATRREHFAKLFNHDNYTMPRLVGRLSEEDELKAAEKLLEDNPTDKELLLGYLFPPDHPYYARAVEKDIETIDYFENFTDLYQKVVEFPRHRATVGLALRKQLETATLLPHHDTYPYRRTYELAIKYGDEETAQVCYNFVIVNIQKLTRKVFLQEGHRWILEHAKPESEEYKRAKVFIPTRREKKQLTEV